jgi:hypothetical protein
VDLPSSHQLFNILETSTFRDSIIDPLFVWKLHAGVLIRESIKAAREEFI